MSLIKDLTKAVEKELKSYAKTKFKDEASELLESVKAFVIANSADMERWLKLFAEGNLKQDEITWLLKSKRDLLELDFLELGGKFLVEMEQTRDEVIQVILKSALSLMV